MKRIILSILVLTATIVTAQNNSGFKSEVRTVNSDPINEDGSTENRYNVVKNAIKFDVVKLVTGDISFAYERAIGFNNGIEVELGPTISHYGLNRMNFIGIFGNIDGYELENSIDNRSQVGFMGSVAFKKYLLKNRPAMNGLYIAPRFKFKNYNDLGKYYDNNGFYKEYKNSLNQAMFLVNLGMNHWFGNNFGIEYYITVGFAVNNFKFHGRQEIYDQNTGYYSTYYAPMTRMLFNPSIGTGFKLNLGF